jgi:hypothetical protein
MKLGKLAALHRFCTIEFMNHQKEVQKTLQGYS